MRPEVHVADDPAGAAAERIAAAVRHGGHLVLTGGATPRAAYERLADEHRRLLRCTVVDELPDARETYVEFAY